MVPKEVKGYLFRIGLNASVFVEIMSDQNICRRDIIFLGSGEWKDIYDAATRMLKKLYIIRPELMWKYMTYVCLACGYVINNVLHEHEIRR